MFDNDTTTTTTVLSTNEGKTLTERGGVAPHIGGWAEARGSSSPIRGEDVQSHEGGGYYMIWPLVQVTGDIQGL